MDPHLSIIIPVLSESKIINQTLSHLAAQSAYGKTEIIVVDGSPQHDTLDAISLTGIKKIFTRHGRGIQMNHGAQIATGKVLLFLHADTFLERDALKSIIETDWKRKIAGGAFHLGIRSERHVFRLIERVVKIRTRLTRTPYGDQAIFLKKDYFHQVGGFKEIPIMEDVELMQRIKKQGWKIVLLSQKAYTSARRWHSEGVFRCTCRNWTIMLLFLLGVSPHRLSAYYR